MAPCILSVRCVALSGKLHRRILKKVRIDTGGGVGDGVGGGVEGWGRSKTCDCHRKKKKKEEKKGRAQHIVETVSCRSARSALTSADVREAHA